MLLNKTIGWKYAGSEMTCKTDDETRGKHIVKRLMKHVRGKNKN
jgi:hypothetical protein